MARPRTPTAALELKGAFKLNPQRKTARAQEPQVTTQPGSAPKWLSKEAKAVWDEMSREGFWLTGADRLQMEIVSDLMVKHRNGTIETAERTQLINGLNKLGFGPAERSKIKAPQPKEEPSGFATFN